jgi:hypothetical protein
LNKQYRLPLASLVSVALHGGLALVLIASNPIHGGKRGTGAGEAPPLAVRLLPAGRAGLAAAAKAPDVPPPTPLTSARADPPSPSPPESPGQAGIRFFTSQELTDAPVLLDRLIGGRVLIVPDVSSQLATITLSVDEWGNVLGVDFEQDSLSDDERHLVKAALFQLKFQPGKIGRITVHSKTTINVLIESTIRS